MLENPQFTMLLRENISEMVEQVSLEKRQSSEKPQVNTLIEDLYEVIKQAVQYTIKAEITMITESLFNTFIGMKNEIDNRRSAFEQYYQAEMARLNQDYHAAIKAMKSDIIEERLKFDRKLSNTKQTIESLASKVRIVEDTQGMISEYESASHLDQLPLDRSTSIKK